MVMNRSKFGRRWREATGVACAGGGPGRARRHGRGGGFPYTGGGPCAGGFTFTEVMFAVVILGIGFIMIAAIFPVAIRQTAQSTEESLAVTAAERAAATLALRATEGLFPPTAPAGIVNIPVTQFEYHPPLVALGEAYRNVGGTKVISNPDAALQWVSFAGDLVSTVDQRLGFAVAYSRGGVVTNNGAVPPRVILPAPTMRVVMVVAQSRNTPRFNETDATATTSQDVRIPQATPPGVTQWTTQYLDELRTPATLQFKRLRARFLRGENGGPDLIRFTDEGSNMTTGGTGPLDGALAVAPGTFVIIADAGNGNPTLVRQPGDATTNFNARANGRVLRVGQPARGSAARSPTFELVAGQDISSLPPQDRPPYFEGSFGSGSIVEVLVLGRALRDPTRPFNAATNPYVGAAMDVAVYTTTVALRP